MRTTIGRTAGALAVAAMLALGAGCANTLESRGTTWRIDTAPSGARLVVFHDDGDLVLQTPCDLTKEVDLDDEIEVSKEGYHTYRGTLRGLPRTSRGTYRIELVPLRQ